MSLHNTTPNDQVNTPTINKDNRDFIYTIPSKVLLDSSLTLIDLKIYMLIRSFMDTTGEAYPSNRWIAEKLSVHQISVSKSIAKMVSKKYITRIEMQGQRYLMTGKPIPTGVPPLVDKSGGVSVEAKGGKRRGLGGVSVEANQLDQILLLQNNNNVVVEKIKNELRNIKPSDMVIKGWIKSYGEEYVLSKIEMLWSKERTNPLGWLIKAIENNYTKALPNSPAPLELWSEDLQKKRNLEAEAFADPQDWRDELQKILVDAACCKRRTI